MNMQKAAEQSVNSLLPTYYNDANGWLAFALIGGGVSLLGAVILGLGTKEQASLQKKRFLQMFKNA